MSKIHIVFGPQGSGKSTYSKKLTGEVKGIHLAIDNWMWKLYGDDLPKTMNLKWIMERVERCEKLIWELSKNISNRCDVILDLGFTKREKRKLFQQLAEENGKEIQLHYVSAKHPIRRKRVLDRNVNRGETFSFEVTPEMFDFMEGEFHKPRESELTNAVIIDNNPKE
ncbi:AAA family ATPase [Rhodohalobacter sulfatireducens]|uniref:ATP-binding protein n=1 Tax=Rhodohalobacter sulfatireducens TaxID=2911366 RepID=A0ABS9KGL3_9BACT|nr:ATP-binding protein [Rhodohalobacter sulfatireducens]MCG2589990.1 ATP-binding protein [Rhodohalobacter sulfatireducens]